MVEIPFRIWNDARISGIQGFYKTVLPYMELTQVSGKEKLRQEVKFTFRNFVPRTPFGTDCVHVLYRSRPFTFTGFWRRVLAVRTVSYGREPCSLGILPITSI